MEKTDKLYQELRSLSREERMLVKAHALGYTQGLPPTIDEFLDSDYYLG